MLQVKENDKHYPEEISLGGEVFLQKQHAINADEIDYIIDYLQELAGLNGHSVNEALPYTFIEVRAIRDLSWYNTRERFYIDTTDGKIWTCQVPSAVPVSCVKDFREGKPSDLTLVADAWDADGRSCKVKMKMKLTPIESEFSGEKFEDLLNSKLGLEA